MKKRFFDALGLLALCALWFTIGLLVTYHKPLPKLDSHGG